MKKIYLLLCIIVLVFTLVACGNSNDDKCVNHVDVNKDEKCDNCGISMPDNDDDDDDQDEPKIYDKSPYKDKWQESSYSYYIYGVWDTSILPDYFPNQPEDNLITNVTTEYSNENHQLISQGNLQIGELYLDKSVERFEVNFYAVKSIIEYLTDQLNSKGFVYRQFYDYSYVSQQEELKGIAAFTKDNYIYISIGLTTTMEGYDYYINITGLEKQFDFPKEFMGVPLPQKGFLTQEGGYAAYSQSNGDWEYLEYTFDRTPVEGEIWGIYELSFDGLTYDDYTNYCNEAVNNGWTIISEDILEDGETTCKISLKKDEIYFMIYYYTEYNQIIIGASNDNNFWG